VDRYRGRLAKESSGPEGMEITMCGCIHKAVTLRCKETKDVMFYGSLLSAFWMAFNHDGRMDAYRLVGVGLEVFLGFWIIACISGVLTTWAIGEG